jgi:hypothetical protein
MQLSSSKGQQSCTDVQPRLAWNEDEVSIGFACSHGTLIWVNMTPDEAAKLANRLAEAAQDALEP